MAKRFFMTQLWRIQQSYTLLSLFLWGVVISLTATPIILAFEQRQLGIDPSIPGVVAGTLILIFLSVFLALFAFGVIYDRYLRLWREQLDVSYERNPYTREKLMVKEILMWRHMFLPVLRVAAPADPSARREIEFVEKWIEQTLSTDAVIRAAVQASERTIESGRASP